MSNNVDNLLVSVENSKLKLDIPPVPKQNEQNINKSPENVQEKPQVDVLHGTSGEKVEEQKQPEIDQEIPEKLQKPENEQPKEEVKEEHQEEKGRIDEYGNPIEKPKMYSEDEVQRMIRERLSRGRH